MSNSKWQKSNNFFMNLLMQSMIKFYLLSRKIMRNLESRSSNPDIEEIFNKLSPFMVEFEKFYKVQKSNINNRTGKVTNLKEKFEELKYKNLPKWIGAIIQIYPDNTTTYKIILPQGKSGINKGTYDIRFFNLKLMRDELATLPDLSAVYQEVEVFCTEIEDLTKSKDTHLSDISYHGNELKVSAEKMAVQLFGAYGSMVSLFAETPDLLLHYIPISYLSRRRKPAAKAVESQKLLIAAEEIKEAGISFNQNQKIYMAMLSGESVKIWFSQTKDSTSVPVNATEIIEGEDLELIVKDIAGIDDRFLMISNTSQTEEAKIDISLYDSK